MNKREHHRLISKSVKGALNEGISFELEDDIINSLSEIQKSIGFFVENYNGCSKGDYQYSIESNSQEYKLRLNNLKKAFIDFKDLCTDDWSEY